jgi:hypothetical protein
MLAVIEQLEACGAYFRSLRDPIDTTTPQGMFSLQVLGAVAQLERAPGDKTAPARSDTHAKMTPISVLSGRDSAPTGGHLMTGRRFSSCAAVGAVLGKEIGDRLDQ